VKNRKILFVKLEKAGNCVQFILIFTQFAARKAVILVKESFAMQRKGENVYTGNNGRRE
jgi:hypothetical protein